MIWDVWKKSKGNEEEIWKGEGFWRKIKDVVMKKEEGWEKKEEEKERKKERKNKF